MIASVKFNTWYSSQIWKAHGLDWRFDYNELTAKRTITAPGFQMEIPIIETARFPNPQAWLEAWAKKNKKRLLSESGQLSLWKSSPSTLASTATASFLEDKSDGEISSRKIPHDTEFLEDKSDEEISSRKIPHGTEFLEDNLDSTKISSLHQRRRKGDGSGCIYWRTVTKKGKQYQEAYYQYEFWEKGDRLIKSSKYIPKHLLSQVQRMETEKAPVREILKVLGVVR